MKQESSLHGFKRILKQNKAEQNRNK